MVFQKQKLCSQHFSEVDNRHIWAKSCKKIEKLNCKKYCEIFLQFTLANEVKINWVKKFEYFTDKLNCEEYWEKKFTIDFLIITFDFYMIGQ